MASTPILWAHDRTRQIGVVEQVGEVMKFRFDEDVLISRDNLFEIFGNAGISVTESKVLPNGTVVILAGSIMGFPLAMLEDWARKWGVPPAALADLRALCGMDHAPAVAIQGKPGSEARQQSLVRLDAPQHGVWLTRNNVGALLDERGVPIRYGLANESKEQNQAIKSADLIEVFVRY